MLVVLLPPFGCAFLGIVLALRESARTSAGTDPKETLMPVRFRMTGCWMSIILSIVLTLLLNLALRGCNTF